MNDLIIVLSIIGIPFLAVLVAGLQMRIQRNRYNKNKKLEDPKWEDVLRANGYTDQDIIKIVDDIIDYYEQGKKLANGK